MPSVSGTGEGIRETAHATAGWVEDAGGSAEVVETGGHPLVLGELAGPPGAPRLLRYGMYDVQPAEEPDWSSPPFGAEIRDVPGVGPSVIARGSANSKGTLACFFIAAEILRDLDAMPATVVLMIEGEEELGSPNLSAAVEAHREELAADVAFDMDLMADIDGCPELITGCKGLLSLEMSVRGGAWGGPDIPLHSSQQAWIASPVWALVHALATLNDGDERIAVPGLLESARPPSEDDLVAIKRLADGFDPQSRLRQSRAHRFRLQGSAEELLRALLFEPTLNIDGIHAGYVGPGGKTIIPSEAMAVLDVRLVPGMDPGPTAGLIRKHLDDRGFGHVDLRVLDSYPWARAEPDNPVSRAFEASFRNMGLSPLPYPLVPWCAPYFVFDRILGLQWACGGAGHASGAHGPDEYASVEGLKQHIIGVAEFLFAYSREVQG